ncbi:hypothetical protein FB45DRAFT_887343 [Roridomyces roridus]|uniref:Uncharacterized protein n=1 Tax=Roridomyces roridus TaxID=1738132 RepID=A0AAD7CJH3_9AGAR|nr:hypothetical protein FB45DRAFT_887343 [Roridomyces roridus]
MLTGCWTTVKSVFYRITLTRFTTAFFVFIFAHAFSEAFLQAFLFSQDSHASNVATDILHQARVPRNNFGILHRHDGHATLQLCNEIPTSFSDPCEKIFETGNRTLQLPTNFNLTTNIFIEGVIPTQGGVNVELDDGQTVSLNQMCTLVLTYPHQVLMNAQREDIVLVLTQFWIFCVSFFAIMYDSIPHLIAALCFRILSTAWSMYIIWRTVDIHSRFEILLNSADSPCQIPGATPVDIVDALFSGYFEAREALQIPDLVMNVVSLCMAIYLSVKLIKVYGPHTFNRVGAPKEIIRIYKYFLAVFVSFQVSALLLISAVCLWLDQLLDRNNAISGMTWHKPLYVALSIFTLAILIPWITMGWYAVRREWKKLMVVFLAIAAIVFTSWILMLKSWSFLWTFINWPFFACQIVAASIALMATITFGIISYLHFGKGLAHYLYVDDVLAKAGFEPELFEKDVEKNAPEDWREIGLDDVPTYTISFTTDKRDLIDPGKQGVDRK